MELITLNLICPSTYQLLWSSGNDSGPDKSASREYLFSLACASLAGLYVDVSYFLSVRFLRNVSFNEGDVPNCHVPSFLPYK
ncbi:hypothetical protein Tco_0258331 [Tanacetum coccineum]